MPARHRPPGDQEAPRGGAQRQPGAEPRRLEGDLLLRARSVLDRSLSSPTRRPARCCARSPTPRPAPTPRACSSLSSAGSWDRTSKKFVFPGIARGQSVLTIVDVDRGKKEREITVDGVDEVTESDLVARRQHDRVLRPGRRLHRPVRLRPQARPAETADDRSVRGARSRLVARRQDAGVQHRSLHDQPADAGRRRPPAGDPRRRRRARSSPRAASKARRTSARSGRPTAEALYFVSDRGGISNIYRTGVRWRDDAADQSADRHQRHHRAEPGAVGRGRPSGLQRLRGQRLHHLRARDGGAAGRRPVQDLPINAAVLPPRKAGAGPVYAALDERNARTAARERDGGPGRGIQAEARSRLRGSADDRRRRRSVRHLCGRRRVVRVQRHARQSLALHRRAGRPAASTSSAATPPTSTARTAGTGASRSTRRRTSTGRSTRASRSVQGVPVYVEEEYRILQIDRSLSGLLSYPFSRSQRIDFSGGGRQIGFKQDLTTRLYDYQLGPAAVGGRGHRSPTSRI